MKPNVLNHPVLLHKLALLRAKETTSMTFRAVMDEISALIAYEATRDLALKTIEIETPLERTQAHALQNNPVVVAIQRAGGGMQGGMLRVLPSATVGHIGIYRDRFIHATVEYYLRLPKDVSGKLVLLADPMLASGDTACAAIDRLKEYSVGEIRLCSILAAPQGLEKVAKVHPDVMIYTVAIERTLNERGYMLPGIGDAGDRLYDVV